jgi:hypothetical protein
MRYFLLMGGFTGFALVFIASSYAGTRPAIALRDAGIGCLVGALLFKLLHAAFVSGLKSWLLERNKQASSLVSDDEDHNPRVS